MARVMLATISVNGETVFKITMRLMPPVNNERSKVEVLCEPVDDQEAIDLLVKEATR